MVSIKLQVTKIGLNQVTSKMQPTVLFESVRESLIDTLEDAQTKIERLTPEASGNAKGSILYETDGTRLDNLYGRVFSDSDYFKYIEYGRRPGRMPPLDAIRRWVRDKGLEDQSDGAVYAIATTIARYGIGGRYIFRDVIADMPNHFKFVWVRKYLETWNGRR